MMFYLSIIIDYLTALTIVFFIHELGHYMWAKIFGVRVEKFCVFFRIKGLGIMRWKPKWSETEFGIGILPLGGYCILTGFGVINAAHEEVLPSWDFRARNFVQRILILLGGVINNLLLGGVLWLWLNYDYRLSEVGFGLLMFLHILKSMTFGLSIVNILPIPCLDGGNIVIEIIEAIRKRPLSKDTIIYVRCVGLFIILILFIVDILSSLI